VLPEVATKPLRDLKNLFVPLLDLWATGYALLGFDGKQLVLVGKVLALD
jgi:hypothetical protein